MSPKTEAVVVEQQPSARPVVDKAMRYAAALAACVLCVMYMALAAAIILASLPSWLVVDSP